MFRRCISIKLLLLVIAVSAVPKRANSAETQEQALKSFCQQYCIDCHSGDSSKGGLDLEQLSTELGDREKLGRWVRIYDRVKAGEMPPRSKPRPDATAERAFLESLSVSLTSADTRLRRTGLRRLTRVEYENTLCDLFGVRLNIKEMLPEDAAVQGFDTVTVGDALAISPEQMEVYLEIADLAVTQALGSEKEPPRISVKMPLGRDEFAGRQVGNLFVKTDEDALIAFQGHWCPTIFHSGTAKADGTYRVRIQAKVHQTQQPLLMAVYGGDVIVGRGPQHLVGYYDVAPGTEWTSITFEDYLEKNGCYHMRPYGLIAPTQGPKRFAGPGLVIGEVSVEGPLEAWPPPSREALLGKVNPTRAGLDEAKEILTRLLPRAFRRSIKSEEVEPFLKLTKSALDDGRPFLEALGLGVKAILCAPEFLLREEGLADKPAQDRKQISAETLASRLSYFLWNSMPDGELLSLASTGRLTEADVLRQQVDRMLNDPKSKRFVENFTGQWLGLRNFNMTEPDGKLFPEFDEVLRYSMVEETHRFFREILDHDLPLLDFVSADWTILNERLARHYGIDTVSGQNFRRVSLPSWSVRGGVLTHASVLKVTANGTTTSPIVRGVWVLKNILGREVPPPPANIPAIEPDIRGAQSIRDQLEKHRKIVSCSVCHNQIDPLGLALETFDPIGGWRDKYRTLGKTQRANLEINNRRVEYGFGRLVQGNGQMADGTKFADVSEFKSKLLEHKSEIAKCLAEKLLTYSLGRELGFSDRQAVQDIVVRIEHNKYGFRSLINEVVQSPIFHQN